MSETAPAEGQDAALATIRAAVAIAEPDRRLEATAAALRNFALGPHDELTLAKARRVITSAKVLAAREVDQLVREALGSGTARPARPPVRAAAPPRLALPMSQPGWAYSVGDDGYERGLYREVKDVWRKVAGLPWSHGRIVRRDGSDRRSGTDYLLAADQDSPRVPVSALKVHDGSAAGELGITLSRDRKVIEAWATAVDVMAYAAEVPELEAIPRTLPDKTLSMPVPECLPAGYMRPSALPRADALARWREVVVPAAEENEALADLLGAAAAGPFLEALGVQSHIVDLVDDPDKGKTTTLRLAASIWGDANGDRGTLRAWNMSEGGPLRYLGSLGILPAFIDESGMADYAPSQWAKIIYRITSGLSRLTAERDGQGMRLGLPWTSIMIVSGNGQITAGLGAGKTAGIPKRVIESGGPYTASAEQCKALKEVALAAYGHLGAEVMTLFGGGGSIGPREVYDAIRAAEREPGVPLIGMPEGGNPRTWAEELHVHVAGAWMLDMILGTGTRLRDSAARFARAYLDSHGFNPLHDADRLLDALLESVAREEARWPTQSEYREQRKARETWEGRSVPAETPLPQHGVVRLDMAGVRDDDGEWLAVFPTPMHSEFAGPLGISEDRAFRELHKRGALKVTDAQRAAGRWETLKRLEPKPARPARMYLLELPPAEDDDAAEGQADAERESQDFSHAPARTSPDSPVTPVTPQVSGTELPVTPPVTPQALPVTPQVSGTELPVTPQVSPALIPPAAAASPVTRPGYGKRDAASALMAAGRRVAWHGGAWLLDGEPVTREGLEQAAAELPDYRPAEHQADAAAVPVPVPADGAAACTACGGALDPVLISLGEVSHPTCDEGDTASRLGEREHQADTPGAAPVPEARPHPWLVLGADGRAYADGGEVLELPRPLAEITSAGELAGLALELRTRRLYVPRPVRELLGLPAEIPLAESVRAGYPHQFTEATDPALWDIWPADPPGLAGWLEVYRMPREQHEGASLAFPEWLHNTPALAELAPAELARALELVHQATTHQGSDRGGVAFHRSPATTFKRLLEQAARGSRHGTPEAVTLPPPYDRTVKRPRGAPVIRVPGPHMAPPAEVAAGWVLGRLDVRSCYAAAATGTDFGLGEAAHRKAEPGASLELDKSPGVHLVMCRADAAAIHPALMPWLPEPGRRRDVLAWLDTLAARWLAERGVPLEVLESWTWPERNRVFDTVTGRLGAAREQLAADGSTAAIAADAVVKAMANTFLGGWLASDFGGDRRDDDWTHNPAWWLTVRVQAEVRKQRNLWPALEAGTVLVLGEQAVDSVYIAAPSLEALEGMPGTSGRPAIAEGRGKFKLEQLAEVTPELAAVLANPKGSGHARLAAIKAALSDAETKRGSDHAWHR